MSTAEKIAEHAVNACSGALALMAGNATGGVTIVKSMMGLAFLGRSLSGNPATEARSRAIAATLATLSANADFGRAESGRVAFLLTEADFKGLTHVALLEAVHAAEGADIGAPLAALLTSRLTFDRDDPATVAVVGLALQSAARACARESAFREGLRELMLIDLVRRNRLQDHFMTGIDAKLDRLLAEKDQTARELGLKEGLVIGLARRVNRDVADFDTALLEFDRALTLAAQMRDQAALPANTSDQVGEVLRDLSALNDQNRLDEGADLIAAELARIDAEKIRLYEAAIGQDFLRRNAASAAQWLVERVKLDDPPDLFAAVSSIGQLSHAQSEYGLIFGAKIAIHLAEKSLRYATAPEQRWIAYNNLGIACGAVGETENDTARLEGAISAHRAALKETERERAPLDWATSQMNLGAALVRLAEREAGTDRVEEAVIALRAAFQEFSQYRTPRDWAKTRMNIGSALLILGRHKSDNSLIKRAVGAFKSALPELVRESALQDWARTQMNLGVALLSLGEREDQIAPFEEAVTAFRAALRVFKHDRHPMECARALMNLGIVLGALGKGEAGTKHFCESVVALSAAAEILRRIGAPRAWAMTQINLGNTLVALARREADTERLRHAIGCYEDAREILTPEHGPLDWSNATVNQGLAIIDLAVMTDNPALAGVAVKDLYEAASQLQAAGHQADANNMEQNARRCAVTFARLWAAKNES